MSGNSTELVILKNITIQKESNQNTLYNLFIIKLFPRIYIFICLKKHQQLFEDLLSTS